ncbi:uncharacterized protein SAPINGB_P002074 [Magnusiomyces paraingens]|uniref:Dolichyl-diphosphooligosaccharide--protein glycosyltransferase subunit 1 n=1 Tax=Magnusiomyces paraingens TaxID=2606893 RepID=A0A5E8BCL5_9ASCO|nr:uncharacterized protein SAPINGB_P002074 [Saprochaete ingens]VVT49039.1 unnamed protein product [Saprochaete ingens]
MKLFSSLSLVTLTAINCLASSVLAFTPPAVFENLVLSRKLDLSGSYVRETVALSIKNTGPKSESVYYFAFEPEHFANIAVFEARLKTSDGSRIIHAVPAEETNDKENVNYYTLTFTEPIEPKEEASIQIGIAYINSIFPSPEFGEQSDPQLLAYENSRFTVSAYPSVRQNLKILTIGLGPQDINYEDAQESFSGNYTLEPTVNEGVLVYGPFDNVPPYTSNSFIVQYEYPRAVVKTVQLQRDIWISHWGSTASFVETYQFHHFGTKLKEGFSRLGYMQRATSYNLNVASYKGIEIHLPEKAREPFYTDLVGNVSTSSFSQQEDHTSLVLRPRYPLFGGWNYNFTIGWSVDLAEYVKTLGPDKYLLRVPLLEGPGEMSYDEVIVNLILPEGATDIDVAALQPFLPETTYITKSYLDFSGRPTVQLVYKNLIDSYKRTSIFVTYTYTTQAAYKKPLAVSGVFAALFTAILFLSKVDIKISSYNPKKTK